MARVVRRGTTPVELPTPPVYVQGSGAAAYKERPPTMTIHMDAGSFVWLWQLLEARKRLADQRAALLPEYQELTARAYRAFCVAARNMEAGVEDEPEEPAPARTGRKVTRRKR